MSPSAYTVRYAVLILFYLFMNFVLFIIVKDNDMRFFIPKINNTKLKYVNKSEYKQSDSLSHKSMFGKVCKKYNVSEDLKKEHFFYNEEHKAMYCWIRKVASTSVTNFFLKLEHRYVDRNYYKESFSMNPKSLKQLTELIDDKNVFKFIVVRHPFERIVSSYRDRFEDNSKYTAQAWIFARRILYLTRPKFKSYSLYQIYDRKKRLKIIPTFSEFIIWLLQQDPSKDDPHWARFADHCSICKINYNKIYHLENNTIKDFQNLSTELGLPKHKVVLENLEKTINGPTNFKQVCQYFKHLSRKQIVQLYNRYKIDFDIFHYDYQNYLSC